MTTLLSSNPGIERLSEYASRPKGIARSVSTLCSCTRR